MLAGGLSCDDAPYSIPLITVTSSAMLYNPRLAAYPQNRPIKSAAIPLSTQLAQVAKQRFADSSSTMGLQNE